MKPHIPILLGLATIGIGVELWLQRPGTGVAEESANKANPMPAISGDTGMNGESSMALQQNNKQLLLRIDQLEQRLEILEQKVSDMETTKTGNTEASTAQNTPKIYRTRRVSPPAGFNSQAMLDAGIAEEQVKRIQQIYDDVEMQKLYLRDQAVREGWVNQKRYDEERLALNQKLQNLRSELSEKEYDAYLYAMGRHNRVIVESTMNNSPAQAAGLRQGDMLIRYDSKPLYSWNDLRTASSGCTLETTVNLEIKRGGISQHLYLPCGPLGVRITSQSHQP